MLPDMIRRINPHAQVIPITTSKDKFTRAQPVAAAWKYGRIRLLEDQPWESQFVTEVRAFTGVGDPHDDQVDALGYFYNGLMDYLIRPTKVYRENRISQITPFG
jgi:predicted phage terminase large subunit-like protein